MRTARTNQEGQVALVALSVTAVLTILSTMLIQRSILEQKITRESEESARALNLAEAGVEEILADDIANKFGAGTEYTGSLGAGLDFIATERSEFSGQELKIGRTRDVEVKNGSRFKFVWSSGSNKQGLLVTLLGDNGMRRYLYGDRNNLSANAIQASEAYYGSSASPDDIPSIPALGVKWVRFKAVGQVVGMDDSIVLSISDETDLPPQEYGVDVEVREGVTSTNLSAEQTIPQLPDVFDYALFSGVDIEKTSNN